MPSCFRTMSNCIHITIIWIHCDIRTPCSHSFVIWSNNGFMDCEKGGGRGFMTCFKNSIDIFCFVLCIVFFIVLWRVTVWMYLVYSFCYIEQGNCTVSTIYHTGGRAVMRIMGVELKGKELTGRGNFPVCRCFRFLESSK